MLEYKLMKKQATIKKWKSTSVLLEKKLLKRLLIGITPFFEAVLVWWSVENGWLGFLMTFVVLIAAFLICLWIDFITSVYGN